MTNDQDNAALRASRVTEGPSVRCLVDLGEGEQGRGGKDHFPLTPPG